MSEPEKNERETRSFSARFGRRAQGNDEKGKEKQELESTQEELEKYWKGLHEFRQFHKGRLDSANNQDNQLYGLGK